jgi:hypothetical protein
VRADTHVDAVGTDGDRATRRWEVSDESMSRAIGRKTATDVRSIRVCSKRVTNTVDINVSRNRGRNIGIYYPAHDTYSAKTWSDDVKGSEG